MGKNWDISDFGMVVGARWAGLSISETDDLLGFSCTTISWVYREFKSEVGSKYPVSSNCVDIVLLISVV